MQNEGRRLWSSITYATRCFARGIWFHVPDFPGAEPNRTEEETRARILVEKKTVVNLLLAFRCGHIYPCYERAEHRRAASR